MEGSDKIVDQNDSIQYGMQGASGIHPPQIQPMPMPIFPQMFNLGSPHMTHPMVTSPMGSAVVTTNLTDQDILKIASVIKETLKEEINAMVTMKVNESTAEMKKEIINLKNQIHDLQMSNEKIQKHQEEAEQYSRKK
jgi:hypothetical protein